EEQILLVGCRRPAGAGRIDRPADSRSYPCNALPETLEILIDCSRDLRCLLRELLCFFRCLPVLLRFQKLAPDQLHLLPDKGVDRLNTFVGWIQMHGSGHVEGADW